MFKENFKETVVPNLILGILGWFGCIFINFLMLGDILMAIYLEIIPGVLGLISIIFFHFIYSETRGLIGKKEGKCLFCSCNFDCDKCEVRSRKRKGG